MFALPMDAVPSPGPTLVQADLDRLGAIAERAGDAITAYAPGGVAVQTKADDSPVTAADMAAHAVIDAALAAWTPDWPRLSEEAAEVPFAQRRVWTRFWLIDPLDGTREFLAGNGEFTVNIALVDNGEPVAGVVHAPAQMVTYIGAVGLGAWQRVPGQDWVAMHTRRPPRNPPTVLVSRSHPGDALAAALDQLGPHQRVGVGSALKFGRLAAGEADIYPRLSLTMEWDTAAGHAVICAAGGVLRCLDGAPLRYNQRPELVNPGFVALADAGIDTRWLA